MDFDSENPFGESKRFQRSTIRGPDGRFGLQFWRGYENRVPDYLTPRMQQVGNLVTLWHGTGADKLVSIAESGLLSIRAARLGKLTGRSKLFGAGIYFATDFGKAFGHASGGIFDTSDYGAMLRCVVALGKSFFPTESGDHKSYLESNGFHSLWAKAGVPITGTSAGQLNYDEIVIYDPQLAIVKEVLLYRLVRKPKPEFVKHITPQNKAQDFHPCKKGEEFCINGFVSSGRFYCLAKTKGSKVVSLGDIKTCPKFEPPKKEKRR